jgi:hypothetical protein
MQRRRKIHHLLSLKKPNVNPRFSEDQEHDHELLQEAMNLQSP